MTRKRKISDVSVAHHSLLPSLLPSRAVIRKLSGFLLTALAVLVGLGIVLFLLQGRLIYFPTIGLSTDPSSAGMEFEEVEVETEDGVRIFGWLIPAPNAKGVLLFSHGNGGSIEHRLLHARTFRDMGLSVLLYDYRGYGRSEGRPGEEGTYLDAVAVHDYLTGERGVDPARLLLFGESLGVAVSIELARRRTVGGMIAESGFTSLKNVGAHHYPWLPVGLLLRHRYENEEKIGELDVPVFFIHSPADEIVPFSHSRSLLAAAAEPKDLLETAGGHNDGGFLQRPEWRRRVRDWAYRVLGADESR